jgi:pimeloyl-ACP methyl ester carboxylesterase
VHVAVGDAEIHYDRHGDGEPLLWLHGGLGHGADWTFIFKEPPAGFQLIAPDLRGHGRSTGAGPTYSFHQSAADMFALLDQLQIERIKMIGLSGGGITALHMAAMQPERVAALVTVSAPTAFPEQAKAIQRVYSESMLPDAERARLRERHRREGQLDTLFSQVRAMPEGGDPNFTPDILMTISAPTLIVFGDRDPLYPISIAFELYQAIPNASLWVVPNGGHGPVFGSHAARFVETAVSFLSGRL